MMRNKLFFCMFLQLIAFCSYADAASKPFFKRVASFADDAARAVAQKAAKLGFKNSFVKGLSKKQKEILLGYYDEFAGVLSAEKAANEPSLKNLKDVIEKSKGNSDEYLQNYVPYTDAVNRVNDTLQAYKGAQKEAARAQALAQKAIEEATERKILLEESEKGLKELSKQMEVELKGLKVSQKLEQRRVEAQQFFTKRAEAAPETITISPSHQYKAKAEGFPQRKTSVSFTPKPAPAAQEAPLAQVPAAQGGSSQSTALVLDKKSLGGSALKTVVKRTSEAVGSAASSAGSLVKSAATSKVAERLYAPLILLGIGTTIAVIEELDRIEQEEKEKLAALEKEQLQNEQKTLRDRLQKAEQQKQVLRVDNQQEEQHIKENQQKEKILIEKEISWQQLSLDVLTNLKELAAEFKKTKSKETEKQFNILSIKLHMMQLLDQTLAQIQTKPVAHKEIQQELDVYKNQIEELKSAFYKEMREKEKSVSFGTVQNRFAEAKVFATPTFKKHGITSVKEMEKELNNVIKKHQELEQFAGFLEAEAKGDVE